MNRFLVLALLSLSLAAALAADNLRVRKPNEDVNSSAVRNRRGLEPNMVMAFMRIGLFIGLPALGMLLGPPLLRSWFA